MKSWYEGLGFERPPERRVAGKDGVIVYRCWGAGSTERGTGYFSLEKPTSVVDAELRFNIVDWGNCIHFVTTFRIKAGFPYLQGPVWHGAADLSRAGTQIYIEPPLTSKVEIIQSREILPQDAFVVPTPGRA